MWIGLGFGLGLGLGVELGLGLGLRYQEREASLLLSHTLILSTATFYLLWTVTKRAVVGCCAIALMSTQAHLLSAKSFITSTRRRSV